MRTEHHLRRPSSPAALLRARMRAGEVSQEVAEARAYLGDEVAREVCGVCVTDCDKRCYDSNGEDCGKGLLRVPSTLTGWAAGLTALLSRLPEWSVEVACRECGPERARLANEARRECADHDSISMAYAVWARGRCCNGSAKATHPVPAARYLSVVGCVAVARACLEECEECTPACGCAEARICASQHPYPVGTTCPDCQGAVEVAESAECWLADPSEGNARAAAGHHPNQPWGDVGSLLLNPPLETSPGAFWRARVPVLLESAATLIDARAVFCAAVLKTLKESAE